MIIENINNLNNSDITNGFISLSTLREMLLDNECIILCHGTLMEMDEIKRIIMKQGLYATGYNENSSLFKTTNPIDVNCDIDELKSKLDNWPHASKNIVFLKLPIKYFNIYTPDQSDLDCQKTRAFTTKIDMEDGRYKYLVNPRFIVGAYNIDSQNVLLNPNYEKDLSDETISVLEDRLTKVQEEMGIIDDVEQINHGFGK